MCWTIGDAGDENNFLMNSDPSEWQPSCMNECNYGLYIGVLTQTSTYWDYSRALACTLWRTPHEACMKIQLPALPNIGCIAPRYLWLGWEGDKNRKIKVCECGGDMNQEMAVYGGLSHSHMPSTRQWIATFNFIWLEYPHMPIQPFSTDTESAMLIHISQRIKDKMQLYVEMCDRCVKQLLAHFSEPLSLYLYHPFPPSIPPTPLSFSVVILFHNLSCCNDRLRQWALCWCLWAEPLRGWDKAKLTSGFSCVTVSFETASEKEENEGKACSSRGCPLYTSPLGSSGHAAAGFCLRLLLQIIISSSRCKRNTEATKELIHPEATSKKKS